ncbi:hypothetical protein LEMLEM_LOCUS18751 [Lemmus lemmus]
MQSTLRELSSSLPASSTNQSTFSTSHAASIPVLRMVFAALKPVSLRSRGRNRREDV